MGLFQSSRFPSLGSPCVRFALDKLQGGCRMVVGGGETRPGWDGPKRRQGFGAESSLECLQMLCVPPMEQVAKFG